MNFSILYRNHEGSTSKYMSPERSFETALRDFYAKFHAQGYTKHDVIRVERLGARPFKRRSSNATSASE